MRFALIATTLAALAVANPVQLEARDDDKPNPNEVTVESVSWAGSGCPAGSVAYDLGEGATVVSLSFDSFVAGTGKGMKATDKRKNCNIRMKMNFPKGWTYTVAKTDVRGYAQIPKTCSATLSATSFFSGQQGEAKCSVPFWGPIDRDYRETTEVDALVWSRCGVKDPLFNTNIAANIQCQNDAILGVDTTDTKFTMIWYLRWKKC